MEKLILPAILVGIAVAFIVFDFNTNGYNTELSWIGSAIGFIGLCLPLQTVIAIWIKKWF